MASTVLSCVGNVSMVTGDLPYCIFSMRVTAYPGRAHLTTREEYKVEFRSRWVQTKVVRHLESLQTVGTAAGIKELKDRADSASLAEALKVIG
jgi:hypothetical protein